MTCWVVGWSTEWTGNTACRLCRGGWHFPMASIPELLTAHSWAQDVWTAGVKATRWKICDRTAVSASMSKRWLEQGKGGYQREIEDWVRSCTVSGPVPYAASSIQNWYAAAAGWESLFVQEKCDEREWREPEQDFPAGRIYKLNRHVFAGSEAVLIKPCNGEKNKQTAPSHTEITGWWWAVGYNSDFRPAARNYLRPGM